jgi:3-hydroxyacyl-CoA dehydrogenase
VPVGPIALLDYVGLDVCRAIGGWIGAPVPRRPRELVDSGSLGRKSASYRYD